MNQRYKCYKGIITVVSPVHIGDGRTIRKNEYIYDDATRKFHIIDIPKLYSNLKPEMQDSLENLFMGQSSYKGIKSWLRAVCSWQTQSQYANFIKYSMQTGTRLYLDRDGEPKQCDLKSFVKNPLSEPYIPGSGIKGMLRSALLSYILHEHGEEYRDAIEKLVDQFYTKDERVGSKKFLMKEIRSFESTLLNSWLYEKKQKVKADNKNKKDDAVNSCLSGLIVGDSEPIALSNLIVCQKIDMSPDGNKNTLPIFSECLKPSTVVEFKLTINSELCPFTIDDIRRAITLYYEDQRQGFISKFKYDLPAKGECMSYLGGGAGFASKTINEALSQADGGNSCLENNVQIFRNTLTQKDRKHGNKTLYEIHKHNLDRTKYHVSPHMLKLTRYQNKDYDLGRISLDFKELKI